MPLTFVDTLSAATDFDFASDYTPIIKDISIARISGLTWLYGQTSNPDDGIIVMRMNNAGALTYLANTGFFGSATLESYDAQDPSGFGVLTVGGNTYLVGANYFNSPADGDFSHGLQFYRVETDGQLVSSAFFPAGNTNERVPATVQIGSDAFSVELLANAAGRYTQLMVSEISDSFGLSARTRTFTLPGASESTVFAATSAEAVAGSGASPVIAYTRADTSAIQWITAPSTGLERTGTLIGSNRNGAAGVATDMEFVGFGDTTLLVTTTPTRGLQAYDMNRFFNPSFFASVGTTASSSSWEAEKIVTFTFQGRTFVVTAGDDLGVFELGARRGAGSDLGDFYLSDTIAHDGDRVHDIVFQQQAGQGYILVSGDDGISSYLFTPGQAQDRTGTSGRDTLLGDNRENKLTGLGGADRLDGKSGNDSLSGSGGNDSLIGGSGNDWLDGGTGNDTLSGSSGNDRMFGGTGKDILSGSAGKDNLYGGAENDRLDGGSAGDFLYGDSGRDRLAGGTGNDILSGGGGRDTFVFADDRSVDRITDWQSADVIDMTDFGRGVRFRDLDISVSHTNVLYTLKIKYDGAALLIVDRDALKVSDLHADDFLFA